jgi:hypothetical protein
LTKKISVPHRRADPGNNGRGAVMLLVGVLFLCSPLFAAAKFYRNNSSDNERARVVAQELAAYYKKSPGFKSAHIIVIDTLALNARVSEKPLSQDAPEGDAAEVRPSRSDKKIMESPVAVWKWNDGEGGLTLRRLQGKFYGTYQRNGLYHVISPYLSGGEWMTMMLVYDDGFPQCGTRAHAKKEVKEGM